MLAPADPSKKAELECPHARESVQLIDEAVKKEAEPCKSKMIGVREVLITRIKEKCGEPPASKEKVPEKPTGGVKPAGGEKAPEKPPEVKK